MRRPDKARPRRQGASDARARLHHRLGGYVGHHRRTFGDSLARLRAAPVQSLMTILVIAIALALPAGLYVGVDNLRQLGGDIRSSGRLSVFLQRDTAASGVDDFLASVRAMAPVAEVSYVSPEEALAEFKAMSGFGEALDFLERNPLPPVVLVWPRPGLETDTRAVAALAEQLGQHALVDDVTVDMLWLQRLQALLDAGRKLAYTLGAVLGLGVLLVLGNTIRLAIENRREEIVVVKLIGGTNAYVRRPFLYTGIWYGAGGGLIAWLLVWGTVYWLRGAIERLAGLYGETFKLAGPGLSGLTLLVAIGAALGLAGAWLAVAQHARRIEPE